MTPTHIGRYEIRGELGRGGMATVFRAYDPHFKREVALKVLPREFLHEPTFRARFEREAQTIAALEHSAIVPVYDYGEQDGQPYLVMRLMAGGSLAERLAPGRMSLSDTIQILSRLAPALDRAHKLGIIHRDLKPGNILFDGEGHPYIADFGLAKLTETSAALSQTGIMGTPAYMSPEQARGDKDLNGRSDLYTLGVILYHMLTGALPYEADTPIGLALKHVTEPPPRLRLARPDLPAGVEAVITRAMAKEPLHRYATAGALLAGLQQALDPHDTQPLRLPAQPEPHQASVVQVQPSVSGEAPATRVEAAGPAAADVPTGALRLPPTPSRAAAGLPGRPAQPAAGPSQVSRKRVPAWLWLMIVSAFAALAMLVAISYVVASLLSQRLAASTATLPGAGPASTLTVPVVAVAETSTHSPETPTDAPGPLPTAEATPSPEPTGTLEPGATAVAGIDGMVQVFVPAGEFVMGDDNGPADQRPTHTVYVDDFWMDRTEVTNAQFAACVGAGVCSPPLSLGSITRSSYYGNPDFNQHPVLFVNWYQARDYCEWTGRRLPTEAEWEKAARGDDMRRFPWGDHPAEPALLNFRPSGFGDTVAVGQYPGNASPYGALDMAGNAWEWVADWYDAGYYARSPAQNPTGPAQTGCPEGDCKVLRGGSWNSTAEEATTTVRLFYGPNDSRDAFTIRCAQSP
jgi:eukaryotic-like serine/threonine-protein kinase